MSVRFRSTMTCMLSPSPEDGRAIRANSACDRTMLRKRLRKMHPWLSRLPI